MGLIDRLARLAAIWAEANARSLPRLATIVVNDGKLFDRLQTGSNCTVATFEKFIAYFRDPLNWAGDVIPAEAVELLDSVSMNVAPDHDAASTAARHAPSPGNCGASTAETIERRVA